MLSFYNLLKQITNPLLNNNNNNNAKENKIIKELDYIVFFLWKLFKKKNINFLSTLFTFNILLSKFYHFVFKFIKKIKTKDLLRFLHVFLLLILNKKATTTTTIHEGFVLSLYLKQNKNKKK